MFRVSSCFLWSFNLGDNIHHNLKILALLYRYFDQASAANRQLLCKPITITLLSIIEAVLYDFHARIVGTRWEILNLPMRVISHIHQSRIDRLSHYIASARKHDFFAAADTDLYDRLDELARLRNRVHIQNEKNDAPRDESAAFTQQRKVQAERALEKVLKTMAAKYPRPPHACGYVPDFELPWEEHFPAPEAENARVD